MRVTCPSKGSLRSRFVFSGPLGIVFSGPTNNHKVVARKACDEVVKSTDLSCQIDSTVLSNRQHDVVKLTVSSCQIDSTNITRLQDNNIYNSIDSNVSYISDDEFNKNNITGNDYYFGKGEIESDSELPF